ncbi:hypothetical protein BH09SUM1_BH09SUM1_08540 [soil metagenome]
MAKKKETPKISDPAADRIVAAARAHFFQHGFRSVTMEDLAREMGMSKKTLYIHFSGKRELLNSVIDQKFAAMALEMDAISPKKPAEFSGALEQMLQCIQKNTREITPTFLRDVERSDASLFERIKSRRRELLGRTMLRILRVGQKAGAVRDDLSTDLMVGILLAAADGAVTPANVAASNVSPHEYMTCFVSIFLRGVMTVKGSTRS